MKMMVMAVVMGKGVERKPADVLRRPQLPRDLGVHHEYQFFTDTTLWTGVFVFSIIILKCIYI